MDGQSSNLMLPCVVLAIVCLVLGILVLMKVNKHCDTSKQTYLNMSKKIKASPPSPGKPTDWSGEASTEDCQAAFDSAGCDDSVDCCDCGTMGTGPKYYCNGTFMDSFQMGLDPSCPQGTPVALNRAMCSKPVEAGPLYCGGSLPDDCQDTGKKCVKQDNLPYGAKGTCS